MRTTFRLIVAAASIASFAACSDQPAPLAPTTSARPNLNFGGGGPGGPPHLPGPNDIMELTAGSFHTCARRRSGLVFCWGQNLTSQIGVPTTAYCGISGALVACAPLPVRVGLGTFATATRVTAGWNHTCVLDTLSTAWCWGSNGSGQIGKGSGGDAPSPTQVVGSQTKFYALAAGGDATCGSVVGLWCWGMYPEGPTPNPYAPNFIPSVALNPLVLTWNNICGNSGNNQWLCWGSNNRGQLAADPATTPSQPPLTQLHAIDGATNVSLAPGVTCVDQASGVTQCFGQNLVSSAIPPLPSFGLLGNPSFTGSFSFIPQTSGTLHGIAVGENHACALDSSGDAFCWGVNDNGQLGTGNTQGSSTPMMVIGGLKFQALAVGRTHTCGITTAFHVYCWGDNYYAELGNNAQVSPVGTPVAAIGM